MSTGISNILVASPTLLRHNVQSAKVAIVLAGRNSAQHLEEALESAFNQRGVCTEVVYADDCSYDDSLFIAEKFECHGLTILPSGVHRGVCDARNRGFLNTSAPYVIFMDTDDRLPPTYTVEMLQAAGMYPNAPFLYPNTQCFGSSTKLWSNIPWDGYDRWEHNQVSTTAMWRRDIVHAAGLWHDLPTMWDYDLALRCSRFGTPIPSKATLEYRIHDDSQSVQLAERMATEAVQYKEMIRRKNVTVGIGCLVSGRLPGLFPHWLSKLACSVRYLQSRQFNNPSWSLPLRKPKLVLVVHVPCSPVGTPHNVASSPQREPLTQATLDMMKREALKYTDTLDITFGTIDNHVDKTTEFARRQSVCRLLSDACNQIQTTLGTDLVWLVEDDIIVPLDGCYLLHQALTEGASPPIGVSGTYYNRHIENQLLGGWIQHGRHCEPDSHFRPKDKVDFVGTGCLMYWRDRPGTPKKWCPLTKINEPGATAHDWAWSEQVEGNLLVLGTVSCDHHKTETEIV